LDTSDLDVASTVDRILERAPHEAAIGGGPGG
jgi:hypothetical protein